MKTGDFQDDGQSAETPASCDRTVDFEVPSSLPLDEKEFFEMMFTKWDAPLLHLSSHPIKLSAQTIAELTDNYFSDVFRRITSEIIADLPAIYEMPAEAVGWVDRVREVISRGDSRLSRDV